MNSILKKNNQHNQSQALLDFVLVLGILVVFLVGLTRVWIWFNANYAKRNVDYQNTRLAAGTANDIHKDMLAYNDKVLKIDDNWVFKGQTSETVGMPPVALFSTIDALDGGNRDGSVIVCNSARDAARALRTEANAMDGQADNLDSFLSWAGSWELEWLFELIGVDIDGMEDARDALYRNANVIRRKAVEIECAGCGTLSVRPYTCS
jgi:hypothetical protein